MIHGQHIGASHIPFKFYRSRRSNGLVDVRRYGQLRFIEHHNTAEMRHCCGAGQSHGCAKHPPERPFGEKAARQMPGELSCIALRSEHKILELTLRPASHCSLHLYQRISKVAADLLKLSVPIGQYESPLQPREPFGKRDVVQAHITSGNLTSCESHTSRLIQGTHETKRRLGHTLDISNACKDLRQSLGFYRLREKIQQV